mmetsp:Transcript_26169/g.44664  ORF Transcript_26169/g.44664 Transcript_26169/m.44664 type:complete len:84 (+) Transcript_26169:1792-2043(+)
MKKKKKKKKSTLEPLKQKLRNSVGGALLQPPTELDVGRSAKAREAARYHAARHFFQGRLCLEARRVTHHPVHVLVVGHKIVVE